MKIRIPRQEIRRILGGRYENLHREFLGIDISGRGVDPIDQNVYYVSYLDTTGWSMFWNDAPALCDFRDGSIYCYHDPLPAFRSPSGSGPPACWLAGHGPGSMRD